MEIQPIARMREVIAELLQTTRYYPDDIPTDEFGMPILEPEPDDPDDE